MSNRFAISAIVSMIVGAVLFGIGAVTVLSTPELAQNAASLLPGVVVASFLLAPLIAWFIAPLLRASAVRASARAERERDVRSRL